MTNTEPTRKRYIIANRRAGLFEKSEQAESRRSMSAAFDLFSSATILNEVAPPDMTARRVVVFEASVDEMQAKQADLPPDAMLEPEILHWPVEIPTHLAPGEFTPAYLSRPLDAAPDLDRPFSVKITGSGAPVAGAEATFYVLVPEIGQVTVDGIGDAAGVINVQVPSGSNVAAVVITPRGRFWTMVAMQPANGGTVDCKPLPDPAGGGWWMDALGVRADELRGADIRVGVVGTGLGAHPFLSHAVGIGSFIDGTRLDGSEAALDILTHDTHCAGIIGGRRTNGAAGFEGIARDCVLFSARVFAPGKPANQGDIATAVDALSKEHHCDLINLSLGASTASTIEQDSITDALERGTLCFAAAGNSRGAILYPAAYPNVVAVSAVGLKGWAPDGTLAATRMPQAPAYFGQQDLYFANFSNFGTGMRCTAPGVGILSTLPDRDGLSGMFGSMDGTSQASPSACASLAVLLARDGQWRGLPPGEGRCQRALEILDAHCRNVGLGPSLQGRGMPYLQDLVV